MIAVCIPLELKAMAFCRIDLGTKDGVNDCWVGIWNALVMPRIVANVKTISLEKKPLVVE